MFWILNLSNIEPSRETEIKILPVEFVSKILGGEDYRVFQFDLHLLWLYLRSKLLRWSRISFHRIEAL